MVVLLRFEIRRLRQKNFPNGSRRLGRVTGKENIQIERRVLLALCQGTPEGSVRAEAADLLREYGWREPVHEVIFKTVLELPTEDPNVIRSLLPERLTRKGFPDVAWEDFSKPHHLTAEDARRLMRELRAL